MKKLLLKRGPQIPSIWNFVRRLGINYKLPGAALAILNRPSLQWALQRITGVFLLIGIPFILGMYYLYSYKMMIVYYLSAETILKTTLVMTIIFLIVVPHMTYGIKSIIFDYTKDKKTREERLHSYTKVYRYMAFFLFMKMIFIMLYIVFYYNGIDPQYYLLKDMLAQLNASGVTFKTSGALYQSTSLVGCNSNIEGDPSITKFKIDPYLAYPYLRYCFDYIDMLELHLNSTDTSDLEKSPIYLNSTDWNMLGTYEKYNAEYIFSKIIDSLPGLCQIWKALDANSKEYFFLLCKNTSSMLASPKEESHIASVIIPADKFYKFASISKTLSNIDIPYITKDQPFHLLRKHNDQDHLPSVVDSVFNSKKNISVSFKDNSIALSPRDQIDILENLYFFYKKLMHKYSDPIIAERMSVIREQIDSLEHRDIIAEEEVIVEDNEKIIDIEEKTYIYASPLPLPLLDNLVFLKEELLAYKNYLMKSSSLLENALFDEPKYHVFFSKSASGSIIVNVEQHFSNSYLNLLNDISSRIMDNSVKSTISPEDLETNPSIHFSINDLLFSQEQGIGSSYYLDRAASIGRNPTSTEPFSSIHNSYLNSSSRFIPLKFSGSSNLDKNFIAGKISRISFIKTRLIDLIDQKVQLSETFPAQKYYKAVHMLFLESSLEESFSNWIHQLIQLVQDKDQEIDTIYLEILDIYNQNNYDINQLTEKELYLLSSFIDKYGYLLEDDLVSIINKSFEFCIDSGLSDDYESYYYHQVDESSLNNDAEKHELYLHRASPFYRKERIILGSDVHVFIDSFKSNDLDDSSGIILFTSKEGMNHYNPFKEGNSYLSSSLSDSSEERTTTYYNSKDSLSNKDRKYIGLIQKYYLEKDLLELPEKYKEEANNIKDNVKTERNIQTRPNVVHNVNADSMHAVDICRNVGRRGGDGLLVENRSGPIVTLSHSNDGEGSSNLCKNTNTFYTKGRLESNDLAPHDLSDLSKRYNKSSQGDNYKLTSIDWTNKNKKTILKYIIWNNNTGYLEYGNVDDILNNNKSIYDNSGCDIYRDQYSFSPFIRNLYDILTTDIKNIKYFINFTTNELLLQNTSTGSSISLPLVDQNYETFIEDDAKDKLLKLKHTNLKLASKASLSFLNSFGTTLFKNISLILDKIEDETGLIIELSEIDYLSSSVSKGLSYDIYHMDLNPLEKGIATK
uniref:succinate dehydrogenase subunit 4 n=1 Tax=Meteora sporadica TaxID=2913902 RepID=UPI0030023543|nr:succinate dehydrogenase subunit 4 [Meteora sporadica]WVH37097.1 succinate dehydrogenase subunit 4 [Meteora sporadica]